MKPLSIFVCFLVLLLSSQPLTAAESSSRIVTGDVVANRTVTLATRIMGRITQVHAEEGDAVKVGNVILEIDDIELQARLRTAQAVKERAMAEVKHRQLVKGRLTKLVQKNAASADAIDKAIYDYEVAQANLKAAQAEIDSIQATLAETRIKVPFDAVIITKYAEVGHVTQPGEPLYLIQDQSRLKFRARVKERDLAHIKLNDTAQLTITALTDEPMTAEVIRIIPSGDARHTFVVELALPARPGLYPGMFGKAVFTEQRRE